MPDDALSSLVRSNSSIAEAQRQEHQISGTTATQISRTTSSQISKSTSTSGFGVGTNNQTSSFPVNESESHSSPLRSEEHQTPRTIPTLESNMERQDQQHQYQIYLNSSVSKSGVETSDDSQHTHFDNTDEQSKPLLGSLSNR